MQEALKKLNPQQSKTILDDLSPYLEGHEFKPETTDVLAQDLSFYKGYSYVEIVQHANHPPQKIHALIQKPAKQPSKKGSPCILDWTNKPIYDVNAKASLVLSEANIRDYVRFFFQNVRGRHGRFLITESVDDIKWQEEPPPAARKTIAKMIHPLKILGMDDAGAYQLQACIMFKDSLFKAEITVDDAGFVEMTNEELVIEDMPVFDESINQ